MTSGVVILNYNSSNLCIKYVNSLLQYNEINHIVIVDNASNDNEQFLIRQYCDKMNIFFIQLDKNIGYAAGNNVGVRFAIDKLHDEVVIISNPDIICPYETMKSILSKFERNNNVAVITGLVHNFDKKRTPKVFTSYAYKVPTYKDILLNNFMIITKLRRMVFKTSMYYDVNTLKKYGEQFVECVSGCFFAIRSDTYSKINGFDEDTFLYYEEAMLGYKLKEAGYKMLVLDYPVYHDEDPDKRKTLKRIWRTHKINQNSANVYMRKYLSVGKGKLFIQNVAASIGFIENWIYGCIK